VFSVTKAFLVVAALYHFNGIFLGIASKYSPHGIAIVLFGSIAVVHALFLW
jgi:hypothetical protein